MYDTSLLSYISVLFPWFLIGWLVGGLVLSLCCDDCTDATHGLFFFLGISLIWNH